MYMLFLIPTCVFFGMVRSSIHGALQLAGVCRSLEWQAIARLGLLGGDICFTERKKLILVHTLPSD